MRNVSAKVRECLSPIRSHTPYCGLPTALSPSPLPVNPPSAVKFIRTRNGGGPPMAVTTPSQLPVGLVHAGALLVWARADTVVRMVRASVISTFFVNIVYLLYFQSLNRVDRTYVELVVG